MDLVISCLEQNEKNDEDDYESYFLQPASSPYNIAEKVQQANIDLFNNSAITMEKTSRVTFKEELASYEPELTDDDVNSIESDQAEAHPHPIQIQSLEYKTANVINLNIFDINEDEEVLEIDEEFIEETVTDEADDMNDSNDENNSSSFNDTINQSLMMGDNKDDHQDNTDEVTTKEYHTTSMVIIGNNDAKNCATNFSKRKKSSKKASHLSSKSSRVEHINCKDHCIEKLPDFDLSVSIKKLEIRERPVNCPLLKLQTRKCCDENKARNPINLPCYNGLRSEYGLSSAELEKREKRKEIIKLKEQKRRQVMQEYKNRKNEQNEAVFCQWLKDVAKRKAQKQKIDRCKSNNCGKECFSPNVINFPRKVGEKVKERPKTADEFVPKHNIKRAKRPHTSPSCVFIEVPQKLLDRGICLGDLLVTSSNFASKKMHILTVSP